MSQLQNNLQVLIVVTNCSELSKEKKTGWYLPEVAHPYYEFINSGIKVTFVSPKGGNAPVDPESVENFKNDELCKKFMKDMVNNNSIVTKKFSEVNLNDFKAIFYAGGHGPMLDLPNNPDSNSAASFIYEHGGIVSAVCHGTVGLLNAKLSDGTNLVKNKKLTSFTDAEERDVKLDKLVPFLLETELKNKGAIFIGQGLWKNNVIVDGRIVTGQNPASASDTGKEIIKKLKTL